MTATAVFIRWGDSPAMDCPTCGKSLSTERGMRQHHTKVHGDPLPNRTCNGCGSEFYDEKARLEYCDDCNPNAGEHNGNWKGAKEQAECERCGSSFEYYPSDKDGVYCPACVEAAEDFLGTPYAETVDPETVTRSCDNCGEQITVLQCNRQYGHGRFCSEECLWDWMSENRRGKQHHQWEGTSKPYHATWSKVRSAALERDEYQCQNCGIHTDEIGRNPDVHHIEPIRTFDDPLDAHYLDNVISLCPSCHAKTETGDITIEGSKDRDDKDNSIKDG